MTPNRLSTFSRAGLSFDVLDDGPLDGTPVILLHGFPANWDSFAEVTPVLHAAGIRTLVPNQRGYSDGARPVRRRDYRSVELQRDVLALMDAANLERAHLVGHDWGGVLAWQLGMAAPHRLVGLTVLSTPHPAALIRAMWSSAQLLRSFYVLVFQLPRLPEVLLRKRLTSVLRRMGLKAPAAVNYGKHMSSPERLTGGLNWYRALCIPDPRASRQRAVTVPATYLWGNGDQALGRRAAELTGLFVQGPYRFEELDEGHWLPENAPALVARAITTDVQKRALVVGQDE
jgi:pimeloyl-ACP methyl ester carboxylesterase